MLPMLGPQVCRRWLNISQEDGRSHRRSRRSSRKAKGPWRGDYKSCQTLTSFLKSTSKRFLRQFARNDDCSSLAKTQLPQRLCPRPMECQQYFNITPPRVNTNLRLIAGVLFSFNQKPTAHGTYHCSFACLMLTWRCKALQVSSFQWLEVSLCCI